MNEDPFEGLRKILLQQQEMLNLITVPSQTYIDQILIPTNAIHQLTKQHLSVIDLGSPLKEFLKFADPTKDVFQISKEMTRIHSMFNQTELIQQIAPQKYQPAISPELFESISSKIKFPEWQYQDYFRNIDLVESIDTLDELAMDLSLESEQIDKGSFSDDQLQFISENIEFWLNGNFSLRSIVARIKGNGVASTILYGYIVKILGWLFVIAIMLDEQRLNADREIVGTIQQFVETTVTSDTSYQVIKKYMETEQLKVSQPLALSRTEVILRQAPGKKAAAIPEATIPPQTVVVILASNPAKVGEKNQFKPAKNWRRVSVEINGSYVEGWVPESTVPRLKYQQITH